MAIELTTRERAVLAHVVVDSDEWIAHALAFWTAHPEGGAGRAEAIVCQHIAEKVAKHAGKYDAAVAADGEAYQTRAQREAA